MKKSLKTLAKLSVPLLPIILNGCVQNIPKDSFCLIYTPVYWYEINETKEQSGNVEKIREQIDLNNLAYDTICEG